MDIITKNKVEKIANTKAKDIIFSVVLPYKSITLPIEAVLFSAVYNDVYSSISLPDAPKTAVDGFAFNVDVIDRYPIEIEVIGEIKAGDTDFISFPKNTAVFIMTGAVVPPEFNAVVRLEDVDIIGKNHIKIVKNIPKNNLINLSESEIKKNEKVMEKGTILTPNKIALLSHIGIKNIEVYRKPNIGLIITGNEIIEPSENYIPSYNYNSNKYIITSFLKRLLIPVRTYPIANDNKFTLQKIMEKAIEENDILITTGGVSRGKYDYVKKILPQIGVKVFFYATNIKPGSPFVFGEYNGKYIFALPGYPSALFVNFLEYVLPAIKKIIGYKEFKNKYYEIELLEKIKTRKKRKDFLRANIIIDKNKIKAIPKKQQETSNFYTTAISDALLVACEEKETYEKGEYIKALIYEPIKISLFP